MDKADLSVCAHRVNVRNKTEDGQRQTTASEPNSKKHQTDLYFTFEALVEEYPNPTYRCGLHVMGIIFKKINCIHYQHSDSNNHLFPGHAEIGFCSSRDDFKMQSGLI